jgi:hypothetical protein
MLPSQLRDDFETTSLFKSNFPTALGGTISPNVCGAVAAGKALVMNGRVSYRRVVTRDFIISSQGYLHFVLQFGNPLTSPSQCGPLTGLASRIIMAYSIDGGISYTQFGLLADLPLSGRFEFNSPFGLPEIFKRPVRILFWQPIRLPAQGINVWVRSIDVIFIASRILVNR